MEAGLSSFGAEMVRLKEALECEGTGLLLLDEIGRGTNPVEGAALAQAVTQTLAEAEHWAVHVTHYREVLMLPDVKAYRVAGLKKQAIAPGTSGGAPSWESATLRQLQAVMDYRLVPLKRGESVPLEGLWIAERLGLPQPIVRLARTYMKKGGGENWKES